MTLTDTDKDRLIAQLSRRIEELERQIAEAGMRGGDPVPYLPYTGGPPVPWIQVTPTVPTWPVVTCHPGPGFGTIRCDGSVGTR